MAGASRCQKLAGLSGDVPDAAASGRLFQNRGGLSLIHERAISVRRSSGYSAALSVVRLALAVAAIPALTYSLGLPLYGLWSVLISLLSLTSLLQLGMAPAVTFQVAQARADTLATKSILVTSFMLFGGLGLLAGLTLFLAAHPIANLVFGHTELVKEAESVLPIVGLAAACQFLRQWVMAAEAGLQRYDLQAWGDGMGTIGLYGGLVVLASLKSGVAVLASWWAFASFGTLLGHWYLWRTRTALAVPLTRGWDSSHARELLHFGLRQWPSQLGGNFFGHVDRVVVNLILGPSAAGLYSAATSVGVRINELSAAPVQVTGPVMASTDSPGRRVAVYRNAQSLNMLLAYLLAAGVMLGAQPLGLILVPTEAETMASVLRISGLCYGVYSMNAVAFYAAQGLGRPSINSRWMLTGGFSFLTLLLPLSATFGLRGAVWANLAFAVTLGINCEVLRHLGLSRIPSAITGGKALLSLAGCFLVSAVALPATDNPLLQLLLAGCTLGLTGLWILLRLLRVATAASRESRASC